MKILPDLGTKFFKDTLWLYLSFIIFVLSGVSINFYILFKYEIIGLGIFIQVYTIYLILSQITVFGIHDSAQRNIANNLSKNNEIIYIKLSTIFISFTIGLIGFISLFYFSDLIGKILGSKQVGVGLKLTSPGILFFSVNKVLLGILNGERRIKLYSLSQSLRSVLLIFFIFMLSIKETNISYLMSCFFYTEIVLFVFLLYFSKINKLSNLVLSRLLFWIKYNFFYGFKLLPNGFLYESYLKIDILMLSFFLSDYKVGIYSFAALFFEGLYQIPSLIRTNTNPVLVLLIKKYKKVKFDKFIYNVTTTSFLITAFGCILLCLLYPLFQPIFPDNIIDKSHLILIILCTGLLVYSFFIPIDFIFIQAGMPGTQSLFMTINIVLNIILNLIFIPNFGLNGAAMATAISLVISGLNLILIMNIKGLFSR